MTSFKIEVQEVLSRICPVEANSREEAIHRVKQLYDDGEISLGADDFVDVQFNVLTEA